MDSKSKADCRPSLALTVLGLKDGLGNFQDFTFLNTAFLPVLFLQLNNYYFLKNFLLEYGRLQASLVTQMIKNFLSMQETQVGKMPWRRGWQHIPVFLPGEFHGQRSLSVGSRRVGHD